MMVDPLAVLLVGLRWYALLLVVLVVLGVAADWWIGRDDE